MRWCEVPSIELNVVFDILDNFLISNTKGTL